MKLFVTVYDDPRLLGHFLRHYEAIGVTSFYIAIPGQLRDEVEKRTGGHPVKIINGLNVADSVSGTAAVSDMRALHQENDEWVVICDLDEFLECESLEDAAEAAERGGANVVRGIMHDRFALDGQPRGFKSDEDLNEVYPIKCRFIREVMHGCDHKGILVKGLLNPTPGAAHHRFTGERGFCGVLDISHYKWTDSSLERVRSAYEIVSDAGVSWAVEYKRVLDHYDQYGKFAWETFGGRPWYEFEPELPAANCVKCGAAISEAELTYSRQNFGRTLCRRDQDELTAQPR
jgi:hypothetical protein